MGEIPGEIQTIYEKVSGNTAEFLNENSRGICGRIYKSLWKNISRNCCLKNFCRGPKENS